MMTHVTDYLFVDEIKKLKRVVEGKETKALQRT